MSGKTLFALLVLVFIVLAPFTVLPALLESATARLLQDQLGLEEAPEVEIESTPAPMMYVGSFSKALVSAKGIDSMNSRGSLWSKRAFHSEIGAGPAL